MASVLRPGVINNWDLMQEQVMFYRDHLDIFIQDQFYPIKLKRIQRVIARAFGRSADCKIVCSRGFGKTWLTALCCFAMCCLYPGTKVIVCSGTAGQATLVLDKIKLLVQQNINMAAQLSTNGSRTLVQLSKDKGKCTFKNGSTIQSFAIESLRGQRAKIVVADETPEINNDDFEAIVSPVRNYTRDICQTYGFKDFESKTVAITSACQKTNSFYNEFLKTARQMARGNSAHFACALNYQAAIRNEITDAQFFQRQRERMASSIFEMQYGSIFVGQSANTAFPFQLTQSCRTMQTVQLEQPKNSKSRYVISLDIATSQASDADNAVITVVKFSQRSDGTFNKKLVYIRSFHGKGLDVLAQQMRKVFHLSFPNAQRLIYDARGLGDSFHKFMDSPWTDPITGKQHPPLVNDDDVTISATSMPILHPIRAVQTLNQRMANALRVMLEKRTIEFPMNSRAIKAKNIDEIKKNSNAKALTDKQMAIYIQTDALQIEMSNIVQKVSASGNYIYDTPRPHMHKDRYSSLAMACDYIAMLEQQNTRKRKRGTPCIGIATDF